VWASVAVCLREAGPTSYLCEKTASQCTAHAFYTIPQHANATAREAGSRRGRRHRHKNKRFGSTAPLLTRNVQLPLECCICICDLETRHRVGCWHVELRRRIPNSRHTVHTGSATCQAIARTHTFRSSSPSSSFFVFSTSSSSRVFRCDFLSDTISSCRSVPSVAISSARLFAATVLASATSTLSFNSATWHRR
jgi:hypothetical protein